MQSHSGVLGLGLQHRDLGGCSTAPTSPPSCLCCSDPKQPSTGLLAHHLCGSHCPRIIAWVLAWPLPPVSGFPLASVHPAPHPHPRARHGLGTQTAPGEPSELISTCCGCSHSVRSTPTPLHQPAVCSEGGCRPAMGRTQPREEGRGEGAPPLPGGDSSPRTPAALPWTGAPSKVFWVFLWKRPLLCFQKAPEVR